MTDVLTEIYILSHLTDDIHDHYKCLTVRVILKLKYFKLKNNCYSNDSQKITIVKYSSTILEW